MLEDLLKMYGAYEMRKVARYEDGSLIVDTVAVTDADQPFETAVSHPSYNDGDWIIVEEYGTKEEAEKGHNRWVQKMTPDGLPDQLVDVSTAWPAKLLRNMETMMYKRSNETGGSNEH